MADKAREWTDKKLKKMENEISKIYSQAEEELTEKWVAYMESGEKRLSSFQNAYSEALKSGDKDMIAKAKDRLDKAKEAYTLQNAEYKAMVEETAMRIANANQIALDYVNDNIPLIYAKNYSQIGIDLKRFKEIYKDFLPQNIMKLVSEDTIKNMIKEGDVKFYKKQLSIFKDVKWNTKKMNSAVLQGIIQGESIPHMAQRIMPIVQNNEASAIRNARTITTGAENRGRLDSYKRLSKAGIVMKKVWEATADGRTRDWHLDMDGQEVDIDKPFIDGNGEELDYPGDSGAPPETVYNCRCSMHARIVGFEKANGEIEYVDYDPVWNDHDEEIFQEKMNRRSKNERKNNR